MRLLKYIYLPHNDEQEIKNLWQSFALEEEQLTLMGLEYEVKNGSYSIGCIQKAETSKHERYLYLYRGLAIIVIQQQFSTNEELSELLVSFSERISKNDGVIGHSTILLNPSKDLLKAYETFFDVNKSKNTELIDGELAFYINDYQDFHQILIYNGDASAELINKSLPVLFGNIFDLSQKIKFYNEQSQTIAYEKSDLDSKIGTIMQQQFKKMTTNENIIERLEDMVTTLAGIYGTLSANTSVLLQNHVALEKDFHITSKQLQNLTLHNNNFLQEEFLISTEDFIKDLFDLIKQLQISIANAKTSIDILQAQINLIRSNDNLVIQQQMQQVLNQNLELQQEAVTLQIGAGLIEFIVVMYYSLSIWKTLAPDSMHHLPAGISFGIVFLFAGFVVWITHKLSKKIIHKKR